MKYFLGACLVLSIILFGATCAHSWVQDEDEALKLLLDAREANLDGDLVGFDAYDRVIILANGREVRRYTLHPNATITRHGIECTLEALRPVSSGVFHSVRIWVDDLGRVMRLDGYLLAFDVTVLGEGDGTITVSLGGQSPITLQLMNDEIRRELRNIGLNRKVTMVLNFRGQVAKIVS